MAAPCELFCWEAGLGLPSVNTDCLIVLVSSSLARVVWMFIRVGFCLRFRRCVENRLGTDPLLKYSGGVIW